MKCREFRSILDGHNMSRLTAAKRGDANAHLAACDHCAAAWVAHDTLLSETFDGPDKESFESVMKGIFRSQRQPAQGETMRFHWRTVAVAAFAVVIIGLTVLMTTFWNDPAPPRTASIDENATALDVSSSTNAFIEGRDYVRINSAGLAPASPQVVEAFMYGCPPCYQFEPYVNEWAAGKDGAVDFVRVPVQWNEYARLHARAYYAAEALGVLDVIHRDFFVEIHENANTLSTEDQLAAFFEEHGISEQVFADAFHSSEVNERLGWAAMMETEFGIDSTPTVIVNGTWLTTGAMARSFENWFAIIEYLVESGGE